MAATVDNGNGTYDDVRCESVQSQRDDIDSYALLGGIVYRQEAGGGSGQAETKKSITHADL